MIFTTINDVVFVILLCTYVVLTASYSKHIADLLQKENKRIHSSDFVFLGSTLITNKCDIEPSASPPSQKNFYFIFGNI
jgi:hypothetical protein